jgi:hypothetical protein
MVLTWQQQLRLQNIRITFEFLRLAVYAISHYHVTTNNTERSSLFEVRSHQVMRALNTRKYMLRFWNCHAFIQTTVGTVQQLLYFSGLNTHATRGYTNYMTTDAQQFSKDSFHLHLLSILGPVPKITVEVIQLYILQKRSHFCHLNTHAYTRNNPRLVQLCAKSVISLNISVIVQYSQFCYYACFVNANWL